MSIGLIYDIYMCVCWISRIYFLINIFYAHILCGFKCPLECTDPTEKNPLIDFADELGENI